jgi:hypothetical protein
VYREDQGNYNRYDRDKEAKKRSKQNLPANSQYNMVMPHRNEHPNAVRLMHAASLNDWSKRWPKTLEIWSRPAAQTTSSTAASTVTRATSASSTSSTTNVSTDTTTTTAQHQRLKRTTNPEVMGEYDIIRTRRSRQQVSTACTINVATSSTSPKSTSSNSVQIVQPPTPTVIDLTVESTEDSMMADVQEQKATQGKRKHVATGNPRG